MMRARVSAKAARSCSALSPMPTRCSCRWRRVSAPMASIFPDSVMTAELRPMPRRCLRSQRWPNGPKAPRRKSGLGLQAQPRPRLLGRRADEFARSLRADGIGPQIVFVGSFDAGEYAVPWLEASLNVAVDLGRVPMRTRDCALIVNLVDYHLDHVANAAREQLGADGLLALHEPRITLGLNLLGHMTLERVGGGAIDILVFEAADAGEPRLVEPMEQKLEILLGLSGEADDESGTDGEIGTDVAPERDALQGLLLMRRPVHGLQHLGARVLERNVEIGKHPAIGHQRQHLIDVRIRIDIMEPHPGA